LRVVTRRDTNFLVSDEEKDEKEPSAKKERVLHTRVPAVLEDELKRLATSLKMPVSNLVRAVLEDAVDAVEVVGERAEGQLRGIVSRIHQQRETLRTAVQGTAAREKAAIEAEPEAAAAPKKPDLDGVVGVQRLTLIAETHCTSCDRVLARGTEAFRGVRDEPGPKVLLGPCCSPFDAD
jgi:hypothetical protein